MGVLGKVGVGDRVWNGVQKSLHSWENPEGLFPWTAHVLPRPDSHVWAEEEGTCQMLPPRAQGGTAVLGKPLGPLSVPLAHQREPGVLGVGLSLSSTISSPSGTKEGRTRAPPRPPKGIASACPGGRGPAGPAEWVGWLFSPSLELF